MQFRAGVASNSRNRPAKQVRDQRWLNQYSLNRDLARRHGSVCSVRQSGMPKEPRRGPAVLDGFTSDSPHGPAGRFPIHPFPLARRMFRALCSAGGPLTSMTRGHNLFRSIGHRGVVPGSYGYNLTRRKWSSGSIAETSSAIASGRVLSRPVASCQRLVASDVLLEGSTPLPKPFRSKTLVLRYGGGEGYLSPPAPAAPPAPRWFRCHLHPALRP